MLTATEFLAATELRDTFVGETTVSTALVIARLTGATLDAVSAAFADVRPDVATLFDAVSCTTGAERSRAA